MSKIGVLVKRAWDKNHEPVTLPDPSYKEIEEISRLVAVQRLMKTTRSKSERRKKFEKRYLEKSRVKDFQKFSFYPSNEAIKILRMAELVFNIRQREVLDRAIRYWADRIGLKEAMARFIAGQQFTKNDISENFRERSLATLADDASEKPV